MACLCSLIPSLHARQIKSKFSGILNGIDSEEWDPSNDELLAANFNAREPLGKGLCKEFLQRVGG